MWLLDVVGGLNKAQNIESNEGWSPKLGQRSAIVESLSCQRLGKASAASQAGG